MHTNEMYINNESVIFFVMRVDEQVIYVIFGYFNCVYKFLSNMEINI